MDDANFESFPDPVDASASGAKARAKRTQRLMRVTLVGVVVRLLIVLAELVGYALYGSVTLLVDALATLGDIAASLLLVAAIWLASRPPDDDHPFGHGRYEPLAGLQMGVMLVLLGLYLFAQNVWFASTEEAAGEISALVAIIPAGAAVLLEVVSRVIRAIGNRYRSSALVAESAHFRIDALTSLVAMVGILVASISPAYGGLVDHLGAICLSIIVMWLGTMTALENVHQLTDRVPEDRSFERVREAALTVEGVLEVEKIRMQHAGPDAHVDIDIEVDPTIRVDEAHVIAQHVRAAIQADWPSVREVVVHVEPYYEGDH